MTTMVKHRSPLVIALAFLALLGCSNDGVGQVKAGSSPVSFQTSDGPDALALIIAISDYGAPPEGMKNARGQDVLAYRPLNAGNDVPLIMRGLQQHGFGKENIQVLADSAADRGGILRALSALEAAAGPGDVVVLHYSGHGHQLTDDDGPQDELDGYDEVLVPYGAPAELVEGYTGEYHIRDDRVGEYIQALREMVGPRGNVTVFLDACYSGEITEEENEDAKTENTTTEEVVFGRSVANAIGSGAGTSESASNRINWMRYRPGGVPGRGVSRWLSSAYWLGCQNRVSAGGRKRRGRAEFLALHVSPWGPMSRSVLW